jgi:hypothetical protein
MQPRPRPAVAARLARLTGALYLVIFAGGLFSELYVRGSLVERGDAAATAANLLREEGLFRLGFAIDLVVFLCDVAVAALLYVLLRPAGRTLSLTAAAFRLTGTAVYGLNLLHALAALLVLDRASPAQALAAEERQALALLFLDIHAQGYDLGLVFFGVHCGLLGWLLCRARGAPGWLAVLVALAGLGYLVGSFTAFLAPAHADAVQAVYLAPLVGELALTVWLLARGGRLCGPGRPRAR